MESPRRQAPVAQTALDRARADVQSDLEHEAKVLLTKSGTSSRATATRQAARLAMVVVSNNLERLVEIRCDDEEWDEKDVCVDMAVDLALKMTRQLCAAQPATFDQMAFDWAQIYSIIDLANRAFSRPGDSVRQISFVPRECVRRAGRNGRTGRRSRRSMNNIINMNAMSMTSQEIADLVEKRHDNVKRAIETLADRGVIVHPQIEDVPGTDAIGRPRSTQVYVFTGEQGKRDSIIVVAQLSPEVHGAAGGPLAGVGSQAEPARHSSVAAGGFAPWRPRLLRSGIGSPWRIEPRLQHWQ